MANQEGRIAQIIGPVIDVAFESVADGKADLPNILDALVIERKGKDPIILECQQHIGEDTVRTISMDSSDGLRRGLPVKATGSPIMMPVGDEVKGRLFNVVDKTARLAAFTRALDH